MSVRPSVLPRAPNVSCAWTRSYRRSEAWSVLQRQGISCQFPRLETALEGVNVSPAAIGEFLCHTGTGGFVRSSAIRDHRAIAWNLADMLGNMVGRNADGAGKFR